MAADEALATLLADAERAQLQLLGAIPDRPERVAQLKDAVLFLLDVLAQVETRAEQREALAALRRVFSPCVAYLYDARAFLDDSAAASVPGSGSGLLMSPRQGVKRGNIVLKALLGAITALSTRSEFPEEIVRGLVDMVRELCAQSIHSADVVMLFDFLRLGKPPTRRWLLQAQRYLVELPPTPQAIFAMQGEHAGIIAPSHVGLLTKKGYTCSFGVRLDPGAPPQMALYSFRGQSGHGVSALLDGNTLVVRSHIGLGAVQQVEVPFAEWRVQMERTWVHLCVVHAKKMVFKDKVTVFADGKSIYTGNLAYPDTLNAAGGQNSVGVMPAAPGIQGKLWSPTLFGLPLSEAEVQKLHWLTHWKNDLSSVAAENVGLADKSKFMFSYDARNCDLDRRICHDVSGNECHGWLEPGTRTYVTQNFVQALDSIGGCACFLLLLLDQVPEMADFHPKTEFGMDEIADLLAFVGSALQSSIECRAHFIRLHGAKVIEFVLQSISPSYLSPDLLDSVVRIIDALISCVENDHQVLNDLIHRLLFFNPNWFLSPFDTQVKLIDEVLPRYLQLLQDHKIRYLHFNHQSSSEPADLFAQNPSLLNDFERPREVDVDFFCNLIVQVYLARESADGECVTTAHMDEYQLKHLRILIIQNLIGRMLSPSPGSSDTSMTQWEQLIAHICRRCGGEAIGSDECAEVEEILSYLTQVLNSDISRTGSFSAPLTRQQLTSAICSVSKGTLRVIWRPMIVSLDSVRLAALRFFESYTSEKVLLRRRDFLMLCSALQAHLLTPLTVDLLLNIVIGRRTADSVANGKSASLQYSTRTSTMARLEFVPTVLLGLLHNAELIDQMQILMEIKTQILSPAVSDIVREAIRAWPPWMSRLQAIALRAGERHEQIINSSAVASASVTESEVSAEALNDVCNALSDEDTPISIKLDALQTIAQSGDQRGCDFALGVLQSNLKSGLVMRAVVNLVSEKFPDRAALVVAKLASQLIVDVVVYSIINVRNGWMHILELFFYYSKRPSDLCNLVAAICDRVLQRVELRQWPGGSGESVVWENLSQVAAIVSQCGTMATAIGLKLGIHEAALSSGQQMIFVRKAFDLWVCVSSHLDEIRWDDLAMHLEANADYGFEITSAEKENFTSLAANYTQAQELMLQTAIKRIRFADFSCRDTSWGLVDAFARMITSMKLIPTTHHLKAPGSRSFSSRMTSTIRSTTGVASPPVSRGSFHGSLPYSGSGNNIAATLSSGSSETAAALDERFRAHLTALNAGFTALDKSLQADSPSAETAQLLVRIMIGLASNGLRTRDEEGESNELLKTLQIISSTDAEFFHEIPQIQELSHLWHLHWDTNYMDESFGCISPVAASASKFLNRWVTVMEQHNREFNPYLIQKHAAVQAEILGNELYSSEQLWKEILDRSTELSTARQSCDGVEEEPRLVELKQDVDKFASSIHKLLTRSSLQNASLLMNGDSANDNPVASDVSLDGNSSMRTTELNNRTSNCDDEVAGDTGPILKVSSRENAFRMRLRLKEVSPNYRIRNLSCECAGSGFLETESKGSGKFIARRLLGSLDHSGGDLDKSWRSDADSDYSDFLADAQMRAAIIRSSSNVDTQGLPLADGFSDDDIDIADDGYDEEVDDGDEDEMQDEAIEENSSTRRVDADALGSPKGLTTTLDQFIAPTEDHESSQSAVIADESSNLPVSTSSSAIPIPVLVSSVPSPPTSAASSLKSIASSPLSAYNFGASVLSAVGGMAGFVQKAAKDAKDVVEYGVDSLYTAKDAFSEEAQSIMQEVSTIMDNNVAQVSLDNLEGPADPVTSPASVSIPGKVAFAAHGDLKNSLRDTSAPSTHLPPTPPVRLNLRSRREIQFRVKLIRHLHVVEGRLLLSDSLFGFIADRVVDEHDAVIVERKGSVPIDKPWRFLFKNRRWRIDDISGLYRRRYLLKPTALEVFIQSTRKNYFFNFTGDEVTAFHEALMNRRPLLLKRDPTVRRLRHPSSIFRNSNMTSRWVNHEVSTFEYLMWLNTIAGRTYNDLTQYPVFPWVIADYESPTLDLSRRSTYRDLSKPMGALEPSRLKFFLDRYQAFDDPDIPKFMYGTHYSNIGAVLYYLIRLEPFTSFALAVQGGKYDHADRLFHCVAETWRNCLTDFTDLKELTPEWFYLPEFLMNRNRLDLGIKQNGVPIGNVVLPPWAKSPEDFVLKNLLVLESDYVSANIHQWIDLVFGAKQRGPAAEAASNIFFYLTYEGMVDIDSITDPVLKSSMRAQIAHFGQTPTQVLRDPHPSRQVQAQDLVPDMLFGPEPEAYLGHAPEILRTAVDMTQLVVPHEAPVVHIAMIPGTSTILCLDSNGMLSTHRYGAKSTKVHHHHQQRDLSQHQHNHLTLNDISASATRATASVFKTTSTPVTSPTNSGQASVDRTHLPVSDFLELQDRKSHRALGEKRLLEGSADSLCLSHRVAFLSSGSVLCSVGHHDFSARFHSAADGSLLYRLLQHSAVVTCLGTNRLGSLLTLGSADGTLSVWKVAHSNSTILDTIKLFRRGARGGVPGTSSKASSLPSSPVSSSKPVLGNDYAADQVLLGHRARINCVSISEELNVCVSGSAANECLAHSLEDGAILRQFDVGTGTLAPGVTAVALSSVGHVIAHSMGSGMPVLLSFHLNGTLLAKLEVPGGHPITFLDICSRSSRVVTNDGNVATVMSALTLRDHQVLLRASDISKSNGLGKDSQKDRITAQALAPDEERVIFGVGVGRIVCVSLPLPSPIDDGT